MRWPQITNGVPPSHDDEHDGLLPNGGEAATEILIYLSLRNNHDRKRAHVANGAPFFPEKNTHDARTTSKKSEHTVSSTGLANPSDENLQN